MNTEETTILEDEQVEDEIVEEATEVEEDDEKEEDNKDPYRAKLNATNRFLQKEGYEFKDGKWVKPQTKVAPKKTEGKTDIELTPKDTLAFMATGVTEEEDIEEVLKLAKGFGMTVSEALKDETVKHRLNVLKEQRKTAEAANTRSARSGAKQVDGKQLVDKLSKGEVPKPGSSDAEELFWARRGGRR
jgi:hypothetical protein